jgi:hypothetical protein
VGDRQTSDLISLLSCFESRLKRETIFSTSYQCHEFITKYIHIAKELNVDKKKRLYLPTG